MKEDEEEDIMRRAGRAEKTYERASKYSEREDRYCAVGTRNPKKKRKRKQAEKGKKVSMGGNTSYQGV